MHQLDEQERYSCPESSRLSRLPYLQGLADENGVLKLTEDECHELTGKICRASCNYLFLFRWHRDLLSYVAQDFGFSEFSRQEHFEDQSYEIKTTTTRGFLVSEDRSMAIWHFALPDSALLPGLVSIRDRREVVSHTFKGERYFLARLEDRMFAYNLERFAAIERLIENLDSTLHTPIESIGIDTESTVLTVKTPWFWVALMGLQGKGFEEEERARLSRRLAESQPFFEFKAPIQIEWNLLKEPKDTTFEEICRLLLLREPGVTRVIPIGKTRAADRGRDLEVHQTVDRLVESTSIKWLVQCKFSTRSVSPDTISGWTDRVREHGYDGYWLMTNNDITPDLFDQFRGIESNTDIKVKFWQQRLTLHPPFLRGWRKRAQRYSLRKSWASIRSKVFLATYCAHPRILGLSTLIRAA